MMNEKTLLKKMTEEYRYYGGLSLLYGLIFAFCLYKNMSGITFPICIISTIIFAVLFMKKINYKLQKNSLPYIAGMVLLGISTTLTTSFFLHFFNLLGIILLFFVFMIHQFYNDRIWSFQEYIKRIFILAGTTMISVNLPYKHGYSYLNGDTEKKKNTTLLAIIIGALVATGSLIIILPLLIKSDVVFSNIIGNVFKNFNIENIIGIILMIIIGFTLSYAFFGAICEYNFPEKKECQVKYFHPVIGITFTSIISIVYLFYSIVQILYLFAGMENGLPANITYAEYARSGFWELLFVSMINFIMVLICMYKFEESKVLKFLLTIISACTFIMIASAAYRMNMYVEVYHLTFLRILVIWFLVVLTFIMAGIILTIYKKAFPLFHYIVAIISIFYIALSFSRPDAIVAKYNIEHCDKMKAADIEHLMWGLSDDAAPYISEIKKENIVEEDYDCVEMEMNDYFKYIYENNKDISIRELNYSNIKAREAAEEYMKNDRGYKKNPLFYF